ncbi:MAG: amidinotransferase [Blastocatellia bacterium]|nr:amidinotransferase [Blastocatellia bacterium]MBN8721955.1 amidinotransferase [Acidobacteriota bacterium]
MTVITNFEAAKTIDLRKIPDRLEPQSILMCPPTYFEVKDIKNSFMQDNLGKVNIDLARRQWEDLRDTFIKLGKQVFIIDAVPELEDMVFAANQVLPYFSKTPYVLLSHMRHASRKKEVPYYQDWFKKRGYEILELDSSQDLLFEGQGDAIWHPAKQMLWGGYGHRTSLAAYQEIAAKLSVPVIALELHTSDFYHLDTCFCVLDPNTVLIYSEAFTKEGLKLIHHFFPRVMEVPAEDAYKTFACNALSLDYKYVVIQQGAEATNEKLYHAGFEVIEVDTSEFIKSGGSVFCLKMMVY